MVSFLSRLLNKGPENMSTEVLLYLFEKNPGLTSFFLKDVLKLDTVMPVNNWSAQQYGKAEESGGSYYDLYYEAEDACIIVENKLYGAGFTDGQPNNYIAQIKNKGKQNGILVMLVPGNLEGYYIDRVRRRIVCAPCVCRKGLSMIKLEDSVNILFVAWEVMIEKFSGYFVTQENAGIYFELLKGLHADMTESITPFNDDDFNAENAELFIRIMATVDYLRSKIEGKLGISTRQSASTVERYFGFNLNYDEEHYYWVGFSTYQWIKNKKKTPFWFQVWKSGLVDNVRKSTTFLSNVDYIDDGKENCLSFPLHVEACGLPGDVADICMEKFDAIWEELQRIR